MFMRRISYTIVLRAMSVNLFACLQNLSQYPAGGLFLILELETFGP